MTAQRNTSVALISDAAPFAIRAERASDVVAREALLDACFGANRHTRTCQRLRDGRAPAEGLALSAVRQGRLVGTLRLWHVSAGGVRALVLKCDVTNETEVEAGFAQVIASFGHLDILVNNAGIQRPQPIVEMSVNDWGNMMSVHLRGGFLCSRAAARHMMARKSGRIINLCSQLGYIGRENYTAYSTAKGGLIAFTRALAKEMAPYGVLVNGVAPGLVDTGFDPLPDEVKAAHAASLPLKRLGMPEDMTPAFVFLASDDARYFCGQLLHPNGGEIMP